MTVQEIVWIASLTAVLAGGIDWLLRLWFEHRARLWSEHQSGSQRQFTELQQQLGKAAEERQQLGKQRATLVRQRDEARANTVTHQQRLARAEGRAKELEEQLHQRVESQTRDAETHTQQICQLTGERDRERARANQAQADAEELSAKLDQLDEQIEQIIKQDERVWERHVAGPSFQPLSGREVPIIAVLNLKGGVGKTTITANLGGLMAQQGKKVLAIDADYQRNLSMLLLSDTDRKLLHLERRTLQHFLKAPSCALHSLLGATSEVSGLPDYRVLANSDALNLPQDAAAPDLEDIGLEDVEMRLMAEWMFRQTGPDVRLRLREALHDLGLKEKGYRYVLIDCPPRLSTACINALGASDFFLIPVILDATSARSVPNLFRTLCQLRAAAIFPHLRCLGIVANGVTVRRGQPIGREAATWEKLPIVCKEAWGRDVHLFRTMVPRSGRIPEAAGPLFGPGERPCLALDDTDIHEVFTALLKEIKTRIDHESKHPTAVSA
jgi:cellulose biosynthesis protein BcsQ